jgi:hypothetical protein
MEIMEESLKYPYLRDPNKTRYYDSVLFGEDKLRYEIYAHMVWNICETVCDRKMVNETSRSAIIAERALHSKWL